MHSDQYVIYSYMPKNHLKIFIIKKVMKIKRISRRSMCLKTSGEKQERTFVGFPDRVSRHHMVKIYVYSYSEYIRENIFKK